MIIHEMLCALVLTKSLRYIWDASSTSQFRSAELQVLSHYMGKGYWFLRFFFFLMWAIYKVSVEFVTYSVASVLCFGSLAVRHVRS